MSAPVPALSIIPLPISRPVSVCTGVWLEGSLSLFDFTLEEAKVVPGDVVKPNSPERKGNLMVLWRDARWDAGCAVHGRV